MSALRNVDSLSPPAGFLRTRKPATTSRIWRRRSRSRRERKFDQQIVSSRAGIGVVEGDPHFVVIGDDQTLDQDPLPLLYLAHAQVSLNQVWLLVRTTGDPANRTDVFAKRIAASAVR